MRQRTTNASVRLVTRLALGVILMYGIAAPGRCQDQAIPLQHSRTEYGGPSAGFQFVRVAGTVNDPTESHGGTAVEIVSSDRFSPFKTDTVDGVVFTVSANKPVFSPGDTISIRYRIRNRTMGTVVYDFNSACQFDLQVAGSRGARLFSYLEKQACPSKPSRITLRPSAETVKEFPLIPLSMNHSDTLRVSAQMAGYPLSAVQLRIPYSAVVAGVSEPVYLEGGKVNKPDVTFNTETNMLVIRLDRAQRLTVSAFVLTGKKVNKLSCEKFLAPGTHLINFNNRKLSNGLVIFKVEGNGFSVSKTIKLTR